MLPLRLRNRTLHRVTKVRNRTFALLLCTGLLTSVAIGQTALPVVVPVGLVAFFEEDTCPSGWGRATDGGGAFLDGRLVVGASDAGKAGATVGTPLADREDRQHSHPFSVPVVLTNKGIAAADGGNNQGARAMTYTATGNTGMAASGIPFVQLLACEKR